MRITTVSSGRMTTQALTSGEPSAARTTVGPNGTLKPRARPPVTAAEPTMKERRFIFMMAPSGFRRGVDGFPDLLESAATADVAHGVVDIGVGGLGLFLQQRRGGHDHSRLAVAALRNVVLEPGLLHLGQHAIRRQTFDRRDLFSLDRGHRHHARANGGAVDVHGAGAALRDAATVFGAGEAGLLPENPQKRRVR